MYQISKRLAMRFMYFILCLVKYLNDTNRETRCRDFAKSKIRRWTHKTSVSLAFEIIYEWVLKNRNIYQAREVFFIGKKSSVPKRKLINSSLGWLSARDEQRWWFVTNSRNAIAERKRGAGNFHESENTEPGTFFLASRSACFTSCARNLALSRRRRHCVSMQLLPAGAALLLRNLQPRKKVATSRG